MPRQTYLQRRKNALSFRIGVPHDLRQIIGSRELTKALGTADIKHAQPTARILAGQAQQLFNRLRGNMARKKTSTDDTFQLDYTLSLTTDELGLTKAVFTDPKPEETQEIIKITQAIDALNSAKVIRYDLRPAALPKAKQITSNALHRLSEVIPYWLSLKETDKKSTTQIYSAAVNLFECHFPSLYVETIEKSHISDFIQWRMSEKKAARTIHKEHGVICTLLNFAVDKGWIKENPASRAKLPKTPKSPIRGYTIEECKLIFNSSVFVAGERPILGRGEAAYWIPLLLLFTGARREEIAQLTKNRVRTLNDIHYLALDAILDEDTLKNSLSVRAVPIHDQLIKMGFLDFVAQSKSGQLFPELKANERDQFGAKWGDWWTKYVRKIVGITDKNIHTCHSFRHLLETEFRALGMRPDYERTILGHIGGMEKKDDHDNYGEQLIEPLYAMINRVNFRGLDLTHLWKH